MSSSNNNVMEKNLVSEAVDKLPFSPQSRFSMFDRRGIDQRSKTFEITVFNQVMFPQLNIYAKSSTMDIQSAYADEEKCSRESVILHAQNTSDPIFQGTTRTRTFPSHKHPSEFKNHKYVQLWLQDSPYGRGKGSVGIKLGYLAYQWGSSYSRSRRNMTKTSTTIPAT